MRGRRPFGIGQTRHDSCARRYTRAPAAGAAALCYPRGDAVAAAEGVRVDVDAALALMKAQFDPAASGSHLASTLQDLLADRPTEIAHLNGAIASRASAHGLAAPANALITQLVKLLEATHSRRVTSVHS